MLSFRATESFSKAMHAQPDGIGVLLCEEQSWYASAAASPGSACRP
jgi:hypothetical protein